MALRVPSLQFLAKVTYTFLASALLSSVSIGPAEQLALTVGRVLVMGVEGIGPSTCRLVGDCSLQLSYTPKGASVS